MLVYPDHSVSRGPREWLDQISWSLRAADASLDACRGHCVDFGEAEAALADAVCPGVTAGKVGGRIWSARPLASRCTIASQS